MKVSIHPNHGCKSRNMTQNQLINQLKNKGDCTHMAILVYLTKLASFQQSPLRQYPAKNSFSQPVVNNDKLAVARSAIAVQQKSITDRGDNTVKGLEQEVTNVAGEEKDMVPHKRG
jgi:hypothetical protein